MTRSRTVVSGIRRFSGSANSADTSQAGRSSRTRRSSKPSRLGHGAICRRSNRRLSSIDGFGATTSGRRSAEVQHDPSPCSSTGRLHVGTAGTDGKTETPPPSPCHARANVVRKTMKRGSTGKKARRMSTGSPGNHRTVCRESQPTMCGAHSDHSRIHRKQGEASRAADFG